MDGRAADRQLQGPDRQAGDQAAAGQLLSVTGLMGDEVITAFATRSLVGLAVVQSGEPRKSWERKRSKRLKRQQPERKEKYRERHYRPNPKQHHKLSKPSAKASIKIFGFVFTRIVLPARELNDRAVLFSHLVSSTQNRECLTESGPAPS